MIRLFIVAGGLFFIAGVIYLALASARMVKRSAWPGDSPQYRNHLAMSRWIDRQLRDDMVAVTIPQTERAEAAKLLEQFYGERGIGHGD